MLHLKGKRAVRVEEIPSTTHSLNKGDVFILDTGLKIYIYNGANSNRYQRAKGVEVASGMYIHPIAGNSFSFSHFDPLTPPLLHNRF